MISFYCHARAGGRPSEVPLWYIHFDAVFFIDLTQRVKPKSGLLKEAAMKVLVPLAEGFEEIEAVSVIDILRRAGIETITAALTENPVRGSHRIAVTADILLDKIQAENSTFGAIILPGGMPGSTNLKNNPRIISLLKEVNKTGGLTAAICAAPIVLSEAGLLKNRKYTCYPGYENEITGGVHIEDYVVSDGQIITGKGAGCAPLFALAAVEFLKGAETARKVKEQIMSFW